MKVAKLKKVEEKKKPVEINDEITAKKLVTTILIILIVLAVFYFITVLVVKPLIEPKQTTPVQFDSNKITMGQLKTRSESDYYALAIKESNYMNLYNDINYTTLYNNYMEEIDLVVKLDDVSIKSNSNPLEDTIDLTEDLSDTVELDKNAD